MHLTPSLGADATQIPKTPYHRQKGILSKIIQSSKSSKAVEREDHFPLFSGETRRRPGRTLYAGKPITHPWRLGGPEKKAVIGTGKGGEGGLGRWWMCVVGRCCPLLWRASRCSAWRACFFCVLYGWCFQMMLMVVDDEERGCAVARLLTTLSILLRSSNRTQHFRVLSMIRIEDPATFGDRRCGKKRDMMVGDNSRGIISTW